MSDTEDDFDRAQPTQEFMQGAHAAFKIRDDKPNDDEWRALCDKARASPSNEFAIGALFAYHIKTVTLIANNNGDPNGILERKGGLQ